MLKTKFKAFFLALFFSISFTVSSQGLLEGGRVNGNLQIDAQYYSEDKQLRITQESMNYRLYGMNAFGNLIYNNGDFTAGMRFESYLNPMLGFDDRFEGTGIPYWFAKYKVGTLEVTAGHFYEQFGSGLILRSWEEWSLGYDNNIYGFNAHFAPMKGVMLQALAGTQRYFWQPYEAGNRGIIRGLDGDFYLNEMFPSLEETKTKIDIGGSFVSKYEQRVARTETYPVDSLYLIDSIEWVQRTIHKLNMPNNVSSWALRGNLARGGFNLYAEYAEKGADPNASNGYIFKKGKAFYSTLSYSTKGLGIFFATKWIDNMSYKSRLTETGTPPMLDINYLPAITKEQYYSLATVYPYATQPNGEFGVQGQIVYTIPKDSQLGGKYGTTISFNYALAKSIQMDTIISEITGEMTGSDGYKTNFFSVGELLFYQDFNVLIERKINTDLSTKIGYFNQTYNKHVIEDAQFDENSMVYANIIVADVTYKITRRNSLRFEAQHLWTEEDRGDWTAIAVEYNVSPKWYFSVQDEFNYGNPESDKQLHYYNVAFGYNQKANRIALRYGRQREGLLCVGGVCRYVPASTGLTLTITSSF
jgi:hypothetical protein